MFAVAAGFLLAYMVAYPAETTEAAVRGLSVWASAVLPSLFPFMVCCQLVAGSEALARVGLPFDKPMRRLTRCPGEAAPLALLGLLGGSPSGAKMIAARFAEGRLTRSQAERLACLTGTVSPMFLLGTLPSWAGFPQAGWLLLGAHWLGALLSGLLFARLLKDDAPSAAAVRAPTAAGISPRQPSLGEAVSASAQAMLTVGGCIVLGTVASAMLMRVCPFLPPTLSASLHAALEMAGGATDMAALGVPMRALLCAFAAIPSLGGLSILAQNLAFLSPVGVRAWPLIAARVAHAAISGLSVWFLAPHALALPVFPASAAAALPAARGLYLCAAPIALWVVARLLPSPGQRPESSKGGSR